MEHHNSPSFWDSFTAIPSPSPAGKGKCSYLGPVVASNRCTCGAEIDIHFCHRQQQNCVKQSIDFEREHDRRFSESKTTKRELLSLLAVCETCPLFQS